MITYQQEKQLIGKLYPIDLFYKNSLDQSEYILPPILFLNALFFHTASLMGIRKVRAKRITNRGEKEIIPNFYGISFASQGVGKDHAFKICKKMFSPAYESVVNGLSAFFEERNADEPDKRYIRISDYFIDVASSEQGIQKAAQTIYDYGRGSVNATSDELGDIISYMEQIFKKLKTAWDDGTSYGILTVSDSGSNYFTVEDITYNALLYGSPEIFSLKKEYKDKLIYAYVSGMVRRSFIYHNEWYRKNEMKNSEQETMSPEEIKEVDDYIKDIFYFVKNTKHIKIPNEIYKRLRQYDEEKQVERDRLRDKSPIAESLGSAKKIEKLLPIIATLDCSEEIKDKHLDFAILFTELVDKTSLSTAEFKSNHILIYEELEKKSWVTRAELVKAIKGLTLKQLEEEMVLVEEYTQKNGGALLKKEQDKMVMYKLEKMSRSGEEKIIISIHEDISKTNPKGFVRKTGSFSGLAKFLKRKIRYSAGTFRDGHIKDENYMQEQNLMILDIDDGMTIDEARTLLSRYKYIIMTTKSHQKEKNGEICDRFRILLPTVATFHLEPDEYKKMYDNFAQALGLYSYDEKCKNPSRWYYGVEDCEVYINDCDDCEKIDIRPFIPDSIDNLNAKKSIENYEKSNTSFEKRVDGAIRWFLQSTSKGNRNDNLFRLAMLLKDNIGIAEWDNIVLQANYMLSEPLSDHDIKSIVRSSQRR